MGNNKNIIRSIAVFVLTLFVFASTVKAQYFLVSHDDIQSSKYHFSPQFVVDNKIKGVRLSISDKPDNQPIYDKGLCEYYEFNDAGYISTSYYTDISTATKTEKNGYYYNKRGNRVSYSTSDYSYSYDTTFTYYVYDKKNQLVIKRTTIDGVMFRSAYYEYFEEGSLKKETMLRETNTSTDPNTFVIGTQTLISSESFEYQSMTANQVKKFCLNDENRPYKIGMLNMNDKKQILEENYEFVVTWLRINKKYKYDDKGRLTEYKYSTNSNDRPADIYKYEYNGDQNIEFIRLYSGDDFLKEISYIYDENKKLVKNQLTRDHKRNSIGIVKFTYTFL